MLRVSKIISKVVYSLSCQNFFFMIIADFKTDSVFFLTTRIKNNFRGKPNYSVMLSIKIVNKSMAALEILVPGPKTPTAPASNKN